MKLCETRELNQDQVEALHQLWNNEYPERLKHASAEEFGNYLNALENKYHLLLINGQAKIQGWCFSFERDGAPWFAIIVSSQSQGQGYGQQLLNTLKKKHSCLYGWVIDHAQDKKVNGQPYPSPLPFYLKNGFKTEPALRLETEKISAVKITWQE